MFMPKKGGKMLLVIDTIKYILSDYRFDANFLETVPLYLENIGEHRYIDGTYITGTLENLKVTVKPHTLKIQNSLCKYYLGNNQETLTQAQIKLANEKISDTLHINISDAKVTRFDIAENYELEYPVKTYLSSLGSLSRYQRLEQASGLLYKINNRQLLFYDKIKELKVHKETIIPQFGDKNILRYEMRFMKNLTKELNESEITPALLSDEIFYSKYKSIYINSFNDINKSKELNFNYNQYKGIKGLSNLGIASLISQYGENNIIDQIKQNYQIGRLTEKEKRGMISKVNELNKHPQIMTYSKLANELNQKINTIN